MPVCGAKTPSGTSLDGLSFALAGDVVQWHRRLQMGNNDRALNHEDAVWRSAFIGDVDMTGRQHPWDARIHSKRGRHHGRLHVEGHMDDAATSSTI
jgi:hypothetical protein